MKTIPLLLTLAALLTTQPVQARHHGCATFSTGYDDVIVADAWGDLQLMSSEPFTATRDGSAVYFGPREYGPAFGYIRVAPGHVVTTTARVQWSLYCERWMTYLWLPGVER